MKWVFKINNSNEESHVYYNVDKEEMFNIIKEEIYKHPYNFSIELNVELFDPEEFVIYSYQIRELSKQEEPKSHRNIWVTWEFNGNIYTVN